MAIEYLKRHLSKVEETTLVHQSGDGKLYLGGLKDIHDGTALKYKNTFSIISKDHLEVFMHDDLSAAIRNNTVKHIHHELEDIPSEQIIVIAESVADEIHAAMEKGEDVYVHCFMGKSRSASCIILYLVKYAGMSLDDAYTYLESKRKLNVNYGFRNQLRIWTSGRTEPKLSIV